MSGGKHTAGVWVIGYGQTHELGEVFGVGIETEPDWTPICILSLSEATNETDEVNARLIAAAPELLEALQNLENDDGHIPAHAWAMVKAAIAKATGEEA